MSWRILWTGTKGLQKYYIFKKIPNIATVEIWSLPIVVSNLVDEVLSLHEIKLTIK